MIERVARALWEDPSAHGEERVPWDDVPGLIARGAFRDSEGEPYDPRDGHRRAARAAIAAMREPTRSMQVAWATVAAKDDQVDTPWNDWWHAMIDAALEEKA